MQNAVAGWLVELIGDSRSYLAFRALSMYTYVGRRPLVIHSQQIIECICTAGRGVSE